MMKKVITVFKRPRLRKPFFIGAWPGMGDVALKAALFLKDALKAEGFADFSPESFFQPSGIDIQDRLISTAKLPEGRFYFCKNPRAKNDIIIFISESQPALEKSYEYAKHIVNFLKEMKVVMGFTFAAMPSPIEHNKKPEVWAATTHKALFEKLKKLSLKMMSTGQISGLNGLILGALKEDCIPGICLLAEIPIYAVQIENPLASLAAVDVLAKMLDIHIDRGTLERQARFMQVEIEKLISFIKDPQQHDEPIGTEEIEKIRDGLRAYTRTPESVRKKIETLFSEAIVDISMAGDLKRELDYWNIYKEYEDRFLDLFKKSQKKNN
ncbi:proteasome assembly chaperone family protein [Thermoproteota archaeon]